MFVLEKVLRSLSEGNLNLDENRNKNIPESSHSSYSFSCSSSSSSSISYFELLNSFDELRKDFKVIKSDSEYYDRIRLLFGNPLKGAIERLQNINNNDPCRFIDDLKILLLAHDNKMKIYNLNSICWTGILIKLANELELEGRRGILRRVLRLLRVSSNLDLEILPLILLNSIRKTISSSRSGIEKISFCLQIIKDYLNNEECKSDQGLLEGLLGVLRSKEICGKIKGMVVEVLRKVWGLDSLSLLDFKTLVREKDKDDSVLLAAIRQNFPELELQLSRGSQLQTSSSGKRKRSEIEIIKTPPKSSSKVVNFLNGIFEDGTEIEREILCNKSKKLLNEYEYELSNYEKLLISRIDEK